MEKPTNLIFFTLFTECPTFNLALGREDYSKTSFLEWEPPCTFDHVIEAIEELNSDSPNSIMLETELLSFTVMGGPERFMCGVSNGTIIEFFLSKEKQVNTNTELRMRVGGKHQTRSGHYALSKQEALVLVKNFVTGRELNHDQMFDVEILNCE